MYRTIMNKRLNMKIKETPHQTVDPRIFGQLTILNDIIKISEYNYRLYLIDINIGCTIPVLEKLKMEYVGEDRIFYVTLIHTGLLHKPKAFIASLGIINKLSIKALFFRDVFSELGYKSQKGTKLITESTILMLCKIKEQLNSPLLTKKELQRHLKYIGFIARKAYNNTRNGQNNVGVEFSFELYLPKPLILPFRSRLQNKGMSYTAHNVGRIVFSTCILPMNRSQSLAIKPLNNKLTMKRCQQLDDIEENYQKYKQIITHNITFIRLRKLLLKDTNLLRAIFAKKEIPNILVNNVALEMLRQNHYPKLCNYEQQYTTIKSLFNHEVNEEIKKSFEYSEFVPIENAGFYDPDYNNENRRKRRRRDSDYYSSKSNDEYM